MRRIFIDCPQEIPCNPCQFSCPVQAITIEGNLTARPKADRERCVGCDNCVAACPGQACFLIDEDYAPGLATIDFPYEYLPLPEPGEECQARDNMGQDICKGTIIKVISRPKWSGTRVVRISVPRDKVYLVRGMARKLSDRKEM